jgi:hypothetical protein
LGTGKIADGPVRLIVLCTANSISPASLVVLRNLNAQYGWCLAKRCVNGGVHG